MENKKVFIDATVKKGLLYSYIFLFIVFSFFYYVGTLDTKRFIFDLVLFAILYLLYSRALVFKIITDTNGISRFGLFKKFHASWHEIISIKQSSSDSFKVETKRGKFSFPLYMKEKHAEYPKLKTSWKGESKWIYQNGIEKELILENCPLYIEIQKHANLSEQQISFIKGKETKLKTASKKPFYIALFVFLIFIVVIYQIMLSQGYSDKSVNSVLYSLIFIFLIVAVFVFLGTYQKK